MKSSTKVLGFLSFCALLIVILLIVFSRFFLRAPEESEKPIKDQSQLSVTESGESEIPITITPDVHKVKITDKGFTPRSIEIRKGETVIWINTGSRIHWPASFIHPTHRLYPQGGGCIGSAFDACRVLASGQSYEFKFEHVGTWEYHDHLNPGLIGVVVVSK